MFLSIMRSEKEFPSAYRSAVVEKIPLETAALSR
jgi:hypothetical protein